jgi:DNA-binding IclR family transcriptional regulator
MTDVTVSGSEGTRQPPSSPPTERTIRIVELLAAEPDRGLSLTEISHQLDISRPTCHAIMATLTDFRWAVRDGSTGRYAWGPAISMLARNAGDHRFRGILQDLHDATALLVFIARPEAGTIAVIDSVGDAPRGPSLRAGFRMPLVAPFGRDYVAWAGADDQQAWLAGISEPSSALHTRLSAVLAEVRRRGVVVERFTSEYVRIYTALRALGSEGPADPITTQLARAFADLTIVDYLPDELDEAQIHPIATVSAPVRNLDNAVVMSVTAAPFGDLTPAQVAALSDHVRAAATRIEGALP